MSKYLGPACRLCRKEGVKLFLKGTRCQSEKCAFNRRDYTPGQHGSKRTKLSDYGFQLREKQKVKRIYGVLEKQFRRYFKLSEKSKGVTGEKLLELLERRLDNVIFRLCYAPSRQAARQIVKHNHIRVDSKRVNIPSFLVKEGDIIEVIGNENFIKNVKQIFGLVKERGAPGWLEVDSENLKGKVVRLPLREDIGFPIQEKLIVELYSK
ncbi:MAG: 30S ribosomal protein S4 [Candidatus Omnitrophica bacterium]|nr:30S ribosomal protein S4 [Candidatus Omnitrophota bacterium]